LSISNQKVAEPGHVLGIDSLRALAVWVVIVYHLNTSFLPGGFVGVDIFFAISGFVITKSLLERAPKSVFSFFTGFYRRRFIRIAPALFVYLAAFTALASYFIPKTTISGGIFDTARWAIFGASNIQLVASSDGYFAERMDYNPFIQTWSLGVEEQFYLIYPVIVIFLVFAIAKSRKLVEKVSVAGLVVLTALSLAVCMWQTANDSLSAFHLLPARFWELSAGGLLYILFSRRVKNSQKASSPALYSVLGFALIAVSLVFANFESFPFWWAIPPVIGALLLIHSSHLKNPGSSSKLYRLATARPIVYFGRISYSLYLWHWGVFVLMRWTIGLTLWWHYALALVITLLASSLSYRFIETPIRTGKFVRKLPDWRVIVAGTISAALVFGAVDFNKGEMIRRAEAAQDPQFKDSKQTIKVLHSIPTTTIGAGHSLIFVGDSHAGHYKYMGHWIEKRTGAELKSVIHYGCAYANLQGVTSKRPAACPTEEEFTAEILKESKPGDVIVLSSFSTPRIAVLDGPLDRQTLLNDLQSEEFNKARELGLTSSIGLIEDLQSHGLKVVLAAPTPVFVSPPDRCIRWFNKMNPICAGGFREPVDYQLKLRAPVMESYREVTSVTGAALWDPFSLMCDESYCYSEKDGRYLYTDQHHLSSNGNLVLVGSFLETLKTIWK
jgi:peptidoglycan/LPS O-acetylase OafA/YrhL